MTLFTSSKPCQTHATTPLPYLLCILFPFYQDQLFFNVWPTLKLWLTYQVLHTHVGGKKKQLTKLHVWGWDLVWLEFIQLPFAVTNSMNRCPTVFRRVFLSSTAGTLKEVSVLSVESFLILLSKLVDF